MGEWSYGRLRIHMNKAFDIGVESLGGSGRAGNAGLEPPSSGHTAEPDKFSLSSKINFTDGVLSADVRAGKSFGAAANGGTFFLETFGCQMNDHDSEKVAGVLLSRGYRAGGGPRAGGAGFFTNI